MRYPVITFEYFQRGRDDATPHRAHIVTATSDHHGIGKTPAIALLNAAMHWVSYEKKHS
jgi:hypothetical protein